MRARVEEARAEGAMTASRSACAALARWLASRDRDLDEAVDLAVEALQIGDDVELRRELAAWLESLGEAGRAAGALRPIAAMKGIESSEAAYVLVRTGVLKARAGAAAGAAAAFEAALPIAPEDALPAELLGALSGGEPGAVSRAASAEAYVEAARRRATQENGEEEELEDLWRAVAADDTSGAAAQALADALRQRGRHDAADEVWRDYARQVGLGDPGRAMAVHTRRRKDASAARASERGLGAALDEGLDARFEGEGADAIDAILFDLGILEVVAARLGVRSSRGPAVNRAAHLVELARLCAGPLADPARASAMYLQALALDPDSAAASAALRGLPGETPRTEEPAHRPEGHASDFRAADAMAWTRAGVAGDARASVWSLERVASGVALPVGSVLLSSAAERSRAAGDAISARRLGELAVRADPASPRAIATLASVMAEGAVDRPAAAALERAISIVGPRATWCAALADALDALGETELSVGWSQRLVALRPGHRPSVEQLLDRLLRCRDGGGLGETLAWLLAQPQPAAWLGVPFAKALRDLAALDVDRAAVVARRALDVLGPKIEPLREAMLDVAERASDAGFAAAVLERWAACGAEGTERSLLLVRLAALRERLGDDDGEARVVARAAQEGVTAPEIDGRLARLNERTLGPDGQLWWLRARAERSAASGDPAAASWAWRDLGAALWDLAEDRLGAITAWQRAARLSDARGHATLALDLVAFAGTAFAFEYLARLIETEPDGRHAATIAADVARAALTTGEPDLAFDLAARGLARSPACADALAVAERAAERTREHPALSALYELVAFRALGRFGRRAAHYRAARFFERRGDPALALKHAAQAFYAVPSEGSAFHLLARAAERADDRSHAVRTIELVAEATERSAARAAWLVRAASIAGDDEDGVRCRVDVLLRAAVAAPSVTTLGMLRAAAGDLLLVEPDEREALEIRLGRAASAITERLDGPEGARVAIAFACASLDLFADAERAMTSIERAIACDADVEEFGELEGRASKLALAKDARGCMGRLLDVAESPHANAGVPVLRLLAAVAAAVGDDGLRARASVAAALREPADDALVSDADAAVRRVPGLGDRLAKRVTVRRRADALLTIARAHVTAGVRGKAIPLFERAVDLLDADERAEVEGELRAARDPAERRGEIDERVRRAATSRSDSPVIRADRWMEIAGRRETRGDKMGAVRALLEACKLDSAPMHRWSSLERVAEAAGDDDARVGALEEIAARVGEDGRLPVFKRLARAHERRSDPSSAAAAWTRVLGLDPDDEEADQAIEALIVAGGRYDALADHLARRSERLNARPGTREMLRAVRLRRAAILEQRLGRVSEACDELGRLLAEWPDHAGGLRYLADLLDRQGEPARAAPLWRRAAAAEKDRDERDELELRAGRASLAAGDLQAALDHAAGLLERNPASPAARDLRIEVGRALGADGELGNALDALALGEGVDPHARSDLLLEAARASARAGDTQVALSRARRAAASARDRAAPQLLACSLEYRQRGAGPPDEARRTIEELTRIREPLGADDDALRAFLLAEALDVVQGGGAGMQELEATRAVVGDHPLVVLGLAERLVARGRYAEGVDAYRTALTGSLLELRHPGIVSLAAADAGVRISRLGDAAWFVGVAERHEETRAAALERRALLEDIDRMARRGTPQPEAPPDPPSVETIRPWRIAPGADARVEDLESAVLAAETPAERGRARLGLGRARLEQGDAPGAESLLAQALADGLVEAGDILAAMLASAPDRAHDAVRVRRQQVALEPGDVGRLESLRVAALADDDRVFARAVEHVMRAFDPGAGPLPPPSLAAQPEQPGIFALLARPSMDAAGEALALLWEGAMQLFVRDAASYGITGVERVAPGPTSVIARLYEAAVRALDAPRIPLFVPRAGAGMSLAQVALLAPPSVILAGDVREDTPELRFALGRGMCAALTPNVLRLGLPPEEGRALVDAMRTAFGPPESGRGVDARAARLAESFWQIVPARTQRRLQELLGASVVDYGELVGRAHESGRRVGMFLSGDFATAARALLVEAGPRAERPSLPSLRNLCDEVPSLADLLRLAVSPEYASARWHAVAPSVLRGTISSGRFNLF